MRSVQATTDHFSRKHSLEFVLPSMTLSARTICFWIFLGSCNLQLCDCLVNRNTLATHVSASQERTKVPQHDDSLGQGEFDRRSFLGTCLIAPLVLGTAESSSAATIETKPDLDCLLDLPPIPDDSVRIFLCRHGQTENNRLRKVQGARVDPPINDNGILQATNMGKALARVNPSPRPFFSSNLKRAKMTAEIAAKQVDPNLPTPGELSSLAEVDFGPVAEGQSIALAKVGMEATAAAWATGKIDYRPSEGGDSGRDVFVRAVESLRALTNEAKASNGSVVAVAHSTFLRILIATVLNEPLVEAESRKIVNGSINVFDIKKDFPCQTIGPKSALIGGKFSLAPDDFSLDVPICNVVRVNESRHLPSL